MRKLLFFLLLLATFSLQAQFKINDRIIAGGFLSDTATTINIRCISIEIKSQSELQRPTFYLAFINKIGKIIDEQNVNYDDMVRACVKNNIPVAQHSAIINQTFSAVLCGAKTQKLAALRALLAGYNIILKPDVEQP